MWWLLACYRGPPATDGVTDGADSAIDTAIDGAAGWSTGGVEACDARVADGPLSSTLLAEADYAAIATRTDSWFEPGGVALIETEAGRYVLYSRPEVGATWGIVGPDGTVTTEAEPAGVRGFAQGDVDGDGRPDVVVFGAGALLVRAFGTPAETRAAIPLDLPEDGRTYVADVAVYDSDGDGLDDLFVQYSDLDADPSRMRPSLLLSDGAGAFTPGVVAGDDTEWGRGYDALPLDLDGDGVLDVLLCNDMGDQVAPDLLLHGAPGALSPATDQLGLDVAMGCMGVFPGDATGDGRLDLFFSDWLGHYLFAGSPIGWVDDSAAQVFATPALPAMAWGAAVTDLDNDGTTDVLVANADFASRGDAGAPLQWFTRAAGTQAAGTWTDVGPARGLPVDEEPHSVVARDLDGDGRLDLLVGDGTHGPRLFTTGGCTAAAWIEVTAPQGTVVRVTTGGTTRIVVASTDAGWASTGPAVAHVGLGDAATIDRIALALPDGTEVVRAGPIAPRQRLVWHRDR